MFIVLALLTMNGPKTPTLSTLWVDELDSLYFRVRDEGLNPLKLVLPSTSYLNVRVVLSCG